MSEAIPLAARIKDKIKHSWAWVGALGGLIAGIIIGVAIAVLIIATAGIGAMVLLAAVVVVCSAISIACVIATTLSALCEFIGSWIPMHDQGEIAAGAATCVIGAWDLNAARAFDELKCKQHGKRQIAQGSETVSIEQKPAARVEDKTDCDGEIESGCKTVAMGGPVGTYLEIHSEMSFHPIFGWIKFGIDTLGVVCGLVAGIGEIEGAFFALKNWKVFGQALSLTMGISAKILEETGHEEAAKWVERAKIPLDVVMAGSDLHHAFEEWHGNQPTHLLGPDGNPVKFNGEPVLPKETPQLVNEHGNPIDSHGDVIPPTETPQLVNAQSQPIDSHGDVIPPKDTPPLVNTQGQPLNPNNAVVPTQQPTLFNGSGQPIDSGGNVLPPQTPPPKLIIP